jgi:hypothetical protein
MHVEQEAYTPTVVSKIRYTDILVYICYVATLSTNIMRHLQVKHEEQLEEAAAIRSTNNMRHLQGKREEHLKDHEF